MSSNVFIPSGFQPYSKSTHSVCGNLGWTLQRMGIQSGYPMVVEMLQYVLTVNTPAYDHSLEKYVKKSATYGE